MCKISYYFNDYNSKGPLWINFDLRSKETLNGATYPFKRYQFCFECNAYLDAHNDPFDWEDMNMPEEVQKMYEDAGYSLENVSMNDEERWENYGNRRWEDAVFLFEGASLLREYNDNYEWREDEEDPDYYVYRDYDDYDPVYN